MKTDLVLLAAGFSSRFPENKLLYELQGKKLIRYTMDAAVDAGFSSIHIVTQYTSVCTIAQEYGLSCIWNEHPETGLADSVKLGVQACNDADAILFLTADMPWIRAQTLKLMASLIDESHILCAWNDGIIRNPMVFPKCYFKELERVEGDTGGKQVALAHPDACINFALPAYEVKDIDTMKDLEEN